MGPPMSETAIISSPCTIRLHIIQNLVGVQYSLEVVGARKQAPREREDYLVTSGFFVGGEVMHGRGKGGHQQEGHATHPTLLLKIEMRAVCTGRRKGTTNERAGEAAASHW